MDVKTKLQKIRKGELKAEENIKGFLDIIKKKNKELNVFLQLNPYAIDQAKEVDKKIRAKKAGKLAGLGIAVKSCINVKGLKANCASKTLEDYTSAYDADAIEKIKKEDGIILGMTNMDEFASGISGETSYFGPTKNPAAKDRIPGGSSSGSAAAVAADMCDVSLGTDTGGSIRNPASHCGVCGIKPSYGRVSRYGLIDLAMSFDQIGPISKDVYLSALVLEVISGRSRNDPSTMDLGPCRLASSKIKNIRLGFFTGSEKLTEDKEISRMVKARSEMLADSMKTKLVDVSLENIDLAVQTYYPIVYVEFFSGTRKFDGRKYGKKIEESCGKEVLRRILGGKEISKAEYHGSYYKKALSVKSLIKKSFDDAFKKVDAILLPVTPKLPHHMGDNLIEKDPELGYKFDAFTIPANLAGICAGVVPGEKIDDIPVGIQVISPAFREDILVSVMKELEMLKVRNNHS